MALARASPLPNQHHSIYKSIAQRGQTFAGWFYDFKLYSVINYRGELLAINVIPRNVDNRKGLLAIASGLFSKLYADKGYIGKEFARQMKDERQWR